MSANRDVYEFDEDYDLDESYEKFMRNKYSQGKRTEARRILEDRLEKKRLRKHLRYFDDDD